MYYTCLMFTHTDVWCSSNFTLDALYVWFTLIGLIMLSSSSPCTRNFQLRLNCEMNTDCRHLNRFLKSVVIPKLEKPLHLTVFWEQKEQSILCFRPNTDGSNWAFSVWACSTPYKWITFLYWLRVLSFLLLAWWTCEEGVYRSVVNRNNL